MSHCCLAVSLVTRYVGAVIAGLASDTCGRKWPLVYSLIFTGALQISGIYCEALESFIAVRAVLITTGGIYGNAMAMGLENCAGVFPPFRIDPTQSFPMEHYQWPPVLLISRLPSPVNLSKLGCHMMNMSQDDLSRGMLPACSGR